MLVTSCRCRPRPPKATREPTRSSTRPRNPRRRRSRRPSQKCPHLPLEPVVTRQYTNYWCVPAATSRRCGTSLEDVEQPAPTPGSSPSTGRSRAAQPVPIPDARAMTSQGWAWALREYTGLRPSRRVAFTAKNAAMGAIVGRRSLGPATRWGSRSTMARTPGSCSATRPQPSASSPSKRTILGFLRERAARPGSRSVEVPLHLDDAFRKVYGTRTTSGSARSSGKNAG